MSYIIVGPLDNCHIILYIILAVSHFSMFANRVDPDETAPRGSTPACLIIKFSLQELSAILFNYPIRIKEQLSRDFPMFQCFGLEETNVNREQVLCFSARGECKRRLKASPGLNELTALLLSTKTVHHWSYAGST